MAVEWRKSAGERQVLFVSGAFDFSLRREFMELLRLCRGAMRPAAFDIDLSEVTRMDTAGLGMLLLLLDRLGIGDNEVALVNCSRTASAVLQFGGFERRFLIPCAVDVPRRRTTDQAALTTAFRSAANQSAKAAAGSGREMK